MLPLVMFDVLLCSPRQTVFCCLLWILHRQRTTAYTARQREAGGLYQGFEKCRSRCGAVGEGIGYLRLSVWYGIV
ncbi:hypothetical protein BDQ17DRAFT_1372852 [Cyathus striatus]|nr:hypothetical protein BDQ17DRAFT_1372852 [Cyathus striatus]